LRRVPHLSAQALKAFLLLRVFLHVPTAKALDDSSSKSCRRFLIFLEWIHQMTHPWIGEQYQSTVVQLVVAHHLKQPMWRNMHGCSHRFKLPYLTKT